MTFWIDYAYLSSWARQPGSEAWQGNSALGRYVTLGESSELRCSTGSQSTRVCWKGKPLGWQPARGQRDCERTALSRVGAGRDVAPSPWVPAVSAPSPHNSPSWQHHCSSPPTARPWQGYNGPSLLYNLLFFFHWMPAVTRHESFPSQGNKLLWRKWALGQGTDQNQGLQRCLHASPGLSGVAPGPALSVSTWELVRKTGSRTH